MFIIDRKTSVRRVFGKGWLPQIVLSTVCSNQYSGHSGVMEVGYVLWSPFKGVSRHWVY